MDLAPRPWAAARCSASPARPSSERPRSSWAMAWWGPRVPVQVTVLMWYHRDINVVERDASACMRRHQASALPLVSEWYRRSIKWVRWLVPQARDGTAIFREGGRFLGDGLVGGRGDEC
jgi:hypothetical protein